jgi:hypothetical protein
MKKIEQESKREIFYLKYKKSYIFDNPSGYNTERNVNSKLTDKITNKRYDEIFIPKMDNLTSRQRYIQNLYNTDKIELDIKQKKSRPKIKRTPFRSKSSNNIDIKKGIFFGSLSAKDNINKKRSMSFFRKSSNNDQKILNILRTTNNHKIRNYYSKFSDIFNLNKNILPYPEKNKKHPSNTINDIDNEIKKIKTKIKPIPINLKGINNTKNYFQRELILKNNTIKSEREKEELLRRKVKEKIYNKKNKIKKENLTNGLLIPIYKFKLQVKNNKTDINNLESVNYNIINNKKNNIRQIYTNLSSAKPSLENISNYEIIIPKNFNKINEVKLKNILHCEGLHFFNFTEQGDIIGGNKGKYIFKIRNSNLDKNFNNKIKNVNSKFSKLNVKLNKINGNYSRKKTDLIPSNPKSKRRK